MDSGMPSHDALEKTLHGMINDLFASPEYGAFFDVRLTKNRYALYVKQRAHYVLTRRNCWGLVQANCPFEVKKLVWEHEEDELAGSRARGVADHPELNRQEGALLGLTPEEIDGSQPTDATIACTLAWENIARTSPWLEAFAASSGLEMINSDEIVKGGGLVRRMGVKLEAEGGIPIKKQTSNKEHMEVDLEHPKVLMKVARTHALDQTSHDQIISGLSRAAAVDRVWRYMMARDMAAAAE